MSDSSDGLLNLLSIAFELHTESEAQSKNRLGEDYEPKRMRVQLFIPNQSLIDPEEPLDVEFIDRLTKTIAIHKPHKGVDRDLLIFISFKSLDYAAICGEDFQRELINRLANSPERNSKEEIS